MSISLVQLKPTDGTCAHSQVATLTAKFDNAVAEGNLIVAVGATYIANYKTSGPYPEPVISDNKGNTWQIDVMSQLFRENSSQRVFTASTLVAVGKGGANFIVSGLQTNGNAWDMAIYELSGTATSVWVDGQNKKTVTVTSSAGSSGTSVPTVGPRFYFAGITYYGDSTTITPDDLVNWTQQNEDESSSYTTLNVCTRAGTGDKSCAWTLGANRIWAAMIAAYKDVDCGGGMILWDGGVIQGNMMFG